MYFSQFWRMESPRSRLWQIWCLVRAGFLIHRHRLLTVSAHGEGGKGHLWSLFYKGIIPIHEGATLMT